MRAQANVFTAWTSAWRSLVAQWDFNIFDNLLLTVGEVSSQLYGPWLAMLFFLLFFTCIEFATSNYLKKCRSILGLVIVQFCHKSNTFYSIRVSVSELFLHDSELGDAVPAEHKRPSPVTQAPAQRKSKPRSTKDADKSKVVDVM